MKEWVRLFVEEVDRIDSFFSSKLNEYQKEFTALKMQFQQRI